MIVVFSMVAGAMVIAGLVPAAEDARAKTAALKLLLNASGVTEGMPKDFTFSLANSKDHDVTLPSPAVECSNSLDGTIALHVKYTPSHGSAPMGGGGGCAGDLYGGWPSILERLKAWKTVGAGESLTIKGNREQFFYSDQRPGKYEFWATYTPPEVNEVDKQFLFGSGIDFPTEVIASGRLTFERKP